MTTVTALGHLNITFNQKFWRPPIKAVKSTIEANTIDEEIEV